VAPRVRVSFFLLTPAGFYSLFPPNRIRLHISPLPCLEHPRAIKTGPPHLPASHPPTNRSSIVPWWPRPKHRPSRPPLRAARSPWFISGLGFALGEFVLKLSTRRCSPFAISCSIARDGPLRPWHRRGEAPSGLFWPERRRPPPRSNLDRSI
jgi:hypothetical protein